MPCRNEVSWCAMLSAYVEGRQGEKALRLYHEALNQMIIPGKVMFVLAVQACSALVKEGTIRKEVSNERVALEIGYALHMDASGERHTSEALVVNTIIRMYGKCGALEEAENAFHALCQPDVVSFNALLSVFVEHNQDDKALSLFCHMIKINMALDPVACICTLQAAGKMGNLITTEFIHFGVICWSLEDIPSLIATLIAAYGNCSCLNAFFLELIIPYMSSWNVSISGYAHGGNLVESMSYTEQLRLMGQKPDSIALTSVLSCYSHSGFVIEGLEFFIRMWEDYHVSADLQHYGAVLDLLARAVSFSKLKDLLKKMPMESDISIWSCVLSACCRHGNKELADFVFDRAIQFEDGAAYVLMSNFFVDALIEDSTIERS
ncbi:hypothetical protein KP509_02G068500 [Ceratopteris richardii]|nr:hypothetical protein KP509_02G068500 [Ceratopteris richardii]